MGRIVGILKYVFVLSLSWVALDMLTGILWPSRINAVPLVLLAVGLFVWRRYHPWYRWQNRMTLERRRAEYARGAIAHDAVWNDPAHQAKMEVFYAELREITRKRELAELRGRLAYDRETQENWNYDGTRKTPREQVVAKMDTYSFEVTEGQYRFMQEFFDDALEPGIYTFKKARSGPERIVQ
jgi:hypothetical protein